MFDFSLSTLIICFSDIEHIVQEEGIGDDMDQLMERLFAADVGLGMKVSF